MGGNEGTFDTSSHSLTLISLTKYHTISYNDIMFIHVYMCLQYVDIKPIVELLTLKNQDQKEEEQLLSR